MAKSLIEVRELLLAHLLNIWGQTTKIIYENANEWDLEDSATILRVEFQFGSGEQFEMATDPDQRQYGNVYFEIWQRPGEGTKSILEYAQILLDGFKFLDLDGVKTQAVQFMDAPKIAGLYGQALYVPFDTVV